MRRRDAGGLSPEMIETLRAVSAAGAQVAGSAISRLTGLDLVFTDPVARTLPPDDVAPLIGGAEAAVAALHLEILGDARGAMLIALSPDSAGRLLDAMIPGRAGRAAPAADPAIVPAGGPRPALTPLDESGLLEMGNILAAAWLNSAGACLGRRLVPSVPRLSIDMAGAVIEPILIDVTRGRHAALVIDAGLRADSAPLEARVLLLHEPAALRMALRTLSEGEGAGPAGEA